MFFKLNFFFAAILLSVLFSCKNESLEVGPITDSSLMVFPEFNFNIETVSPSDTLRLGSTITYNLYIRQQLTHVKGRKYFVTFFLPQSFDGEATIYNTPWRTGDKVMVDYDTIVKHNYRVGFTYRPKHKNTGNYTINLECSDESGKTATYAKQIIVR